MKTIILQSEDTLDLRLILDLVKRLGIQYVETDEELDVEDLVSSEPNASLLDDEQSLDTSALYEGLGLDNEIKVTTIDTLQDISNDDLLETKYTPDPESAKKVYGAWEDDDSETLEDLLNMLTP